MINGGISPDELSLLLGQRKSEEKAASNLSQLEKEALTEFLNVSFGSSSAVLSTLFSEQVSIMAPELSITQKEDILTELTYPTFVVLGEYTGTISGRQFLFINNGFTQMMDISSEAEDIEKQFQVVQEVVEQMFTAVSQSMAAILDQEVSHLLSGMDRIESRQDFQVDRFTEEEWFVQAAFHIIAGNQKNLSFTLSIPVGTAKQMVGILTEPIDEDNREEMEFQSMNQSNATNQPKNSGVTPKVQPVQFSSFDESPSQHSEPNNLTMLLDIPLQVTVELGRTKKMVKDILEVSPGSIIELDKLAGEPVDILINNKLIAVGEVVVIDENFGVRVTDILSTVDRISKLR